MYFLTTNSFSYQLILFHFVQFATLARMLQADPPPKAVKVTMSKRVPLVGEELIAYEEEQNRIKKEEALKASQVKEEELKVSHSTSDPMVIDATENHVSTEGMHPIIIFLCENLNCFPLPSCTVSAINIFIEGMHFAPTDFLHVYLKNF